MKEINVIIKKFSNTFNMIRYTDNEIKFNECMLS